MTAPARSDLPTLLQSQRALEDRICAIGGDAKEVLALGAEVLAFAEREEPALFPLLPLLDPAARAELGGEHEQLAEDLQLLQSLADAAPDSADVTELAAALACRMRAHIQRDGRLLAQAARLAGL